MTTQDYRLIGRGLYSIREASMLSGIPARRLRRWAIGYSYTVKGVKRQSAPVIGLDLEADLDRVTLTFADLIEVRFLDAFLGLGVSWKTIRIAAGRAQEILNLPHPFSSRRFRTDGKTILAELSTATDVQLLDLVKNQYAIPKILESSLYQGIEWGTDEPERWWPLEDRRTIVVDPARAFGAPIVASKGVATSIVARMRIAEGAIEPVAEWFGITAEEVSDAVEFEASMAA